VLGALWTVFLTIVIVADAQDNEPTPDRTGWLLALRASEVHVPRRQVVEGLVRSQRVVGVAEAVDLDGQGVLLPPVDLDLTRIGPRKFWAPGGARTLRATPLRVQRGSWWSPQRSGGRGLTMYTGCVP
jgi:hypothetical protein